MENEVVSPCKVHCIVTSTIFEIVMQAGNDYSLPRFIMTF